MVTEYHAPGNLSKVIDRLPVKFVGGRLCLDFVNTVGGRSSDGAPLREKLEDYTGLLAWCVRAGIEERGRANAMAHASGRQPQLATAVFARAISLREATYRLFRSELEKSAPRARDVRTLDAAILAAHTQQHLIHESKGFVYAFAPAPALDRILWPLALSAADLLTSPELNQLGACAGDDCGWLFLDTSRNHRRQWCDMRDCGNRAKVRRWREHAARRQSGLRIPNSSR